MQEKSLSFFCFCQAEAEKVSERRARGEFAYDLRLSDRAITMKGCPDKVDWAEWIRRGRTIPVESVRLLLSGAEQQSVIEGADGCV